MNGASADTLQRWKLMLGAWGSVGLVYFGTGYLPRQAQVLPLGWVDRWVDFHLHSVWLYLAFFLLVPWAFFHSTPAKARRLALAMPLCAGVCVVCFGMWPTTLPLETQQAGMQASSQAGLSAWAYHLLIAGDTPKNCFPSLHGALTLLSAWALCERDRPVRSVLAVTLALAIAWSVLALRRHVAVDLASGILLGVLAGHWAQRLLARGVRA